MTRIINEKCKPPPVDQPEVPSSETRVVDHHFRPDQHKKTRIPYPEEQIRKVFKSFDKDRDGQLSKAELEAAFAKLGAKWTSVRAWLSLWHADDNGDDFISLDNELDKLVDYALKLGYSLN